MDISPIDTSLSLYIEMLTRFSHMEACLSAVLSSSNKLVPNELHKLSQEIFDLLGQMSVDIHDGNREAIELQTSRFLHLFSIWETKSRNLLLEIGHLKPSLTEVN